MRTTFNDYKEYYRIIRDNDGEEISLQVYELYGDLSLPPISSAEMVTCTCCDVLFWKPRKLQNRGGKSDMWLMKRGKKILVEKENIRTAQTEDPELKGIWIETHLSLSKQLNCNVKQKQLKHDLDGNSFTFTKIKNKNDKISSEQPNATNYTKWNLFSLQISS